MDPRSALPINNSDVVRGNLDKESFLERRLEALLERMDRLSIAVEKSGVTIYQRRLNATAMVRQIIAMNFSSTLHDVPLYFIFAGKSRPNWFIRICSGYGPLYDTTSWHRREVNSISSLHSGDLFRWTDDVDHRIH